MIKKIKKNDVSRVNFLDGFKEPSKKYIDVPLEQHRDLIERLIKEGADDRDICLSVKREASGFVMNSDIKESIDSLKAQGVEDLSDIAKEVDEELSELGDEVEAKMVRVAPNFDLKIDTNGEEDGDFDLNKFQSYIKDKVRSEYDREAVEAESSDEEYSRHNRGIRIRQEMIDEEIKEIEEQELIPFPETCNMTSEVRVKVDKERIPLAERLVYWIEHDENGEIFVHCPAWVRGVNCDRVVIEPHKNASPVDDHQVVVHRSQVHTPAQKITPWVG